MKRTTFLDPVPVLISDLSYNGTGEVVRVYERREWYRRVKFSGRYLLQRITWEEYERKEAQINRKQAREQYSKAIQEKYNVGPGWENNRWFVEQVRPTLLYH